MEPWAIFSSRCLFAAFAMICGYIGWFGFVLVFVRAFLVSIQRLDRRPTLLHESRCACIELENIFHAYAGSQSLIRTFAILHGSNTATSLLLPLGLPITAGSSVKGEF